MSCTGEKKAQAEVLARASRIAGSQVNGALYCLYPGCGQSLMTNQDCPRGHSQHPGDVAQSLVAAAHNLQGAWAGSSSRAPERQTDLRQARQYAELAWAVYGTHGDGAQATATSALVARLWEEEERAGGGRMLVSLPDRRRALELLKEPRLRQRLARADQMYLQGHPSGVEVVYRKGQRVYSLNLAKVPSGRLGGGEYTWLVSPFRPVAIGRQEAVAWMDRMTEVVAEGGTLLCQNCGAAQVGYDCPDCAQRRREIGVKLDALPAGTVIEVPAQLVRNLPNSKYLRGRWQAVDSGEGRVWAAVGDNADDALRGTGVFGYLTDELIDAERAVAVVGQSEELPARAAQHLYLGVVNQQLPRLLGTRIGADRGAQHYANALFRAMFDGKKPRYIQTLAASLSRRLRQARQTLENTPECPKYAAEQQHRLTLVRQAETTMTAVMQAWQAGRVEPARKGLDAVYQMTRWANARGSNLAQWATGPDDLAKALRGEAPFPGVPAEDNAQ